MRYLLTFTFPSTSKGTWTLLLIKHRSNNCVFFWQVINDEDEFRITLDVSDYSPCEISLKTKNSRVVVHARHGERADAFGLVEREFRRQYVLPKVIYFY